MRFRHGGSKQAYPRGRPAGGGLWAVWRHKHGPWRNTGKGERMEDNGLAEGMAQPYLVPGARPS